jgi:hypothetical protein
LWQNGNEDFFYRYRSPVDDSIKQYKIGTFPQVTLAEARIELIRLKAERNQGICPKHKKEQEKLQQQIEQELAQKDMSQLTVQQMIEMYLTEVIEDHWITDPRTGKGKRFWGCESLKVNLKHDELVWRCGTGFGKSYCFGSNSKRCGGFNQRNY